MTILSIRKYYESCNNIANDDEFLNEVSSKSMAWGLSIIPDISNKPLVPLCGRFSLLPRPYPRSLFNKVIATVPHFNKLIEGISKDPEWIIESLESVISSDDFTRHLIDICKRIYINKSTSSKWSKDAIRLHLLRSDYLASSDNSRILQVEINTISVAFIGLAEKLSVLHKYTAFSKVGSDSLKDLPVNNCCYNFAKSMSDAHNKYIEKYNGKFQYPFCFLFIVEKSEKNIYDQHALEYQLINSFNILVIRKTLTSISDNIQIGSNGELLLKSDNSILEISLIYFRAGYGPQHYPSNIEWKSRELIETSRAIKCPSIVGQLAGTKKIQQLWYSNNGVYLNRFGLSPVEISELFEIFAIQLDPSDDKNKNLINDALANSDRWVLKPQREGGGNNIYDQELINALTTLPKSELKQLVLMERIVPSPLPSVVVKDRENKMTAIVMNETVSELGILSTYISSDDNYDNYCGHLLRTKNISEKEGGVNAGFAFLDTAYLIDEIIE